MTTPMSEDGGPLREWAPLTNLLQQIPMKLQNGIFAHDIVFTCIDALPEFLAVGTNCGLIYWYDRKTSRVQRLRCENTNSNVTCLRIISTVDFMVAAGTEHGVVTVFQIPKDLPASLPESLKPKRKKQVERYNICGLHRAPVTTVEWSKNGMKLFSGDQEGSVVLTEIDFYMHLSKSSELLNEKYPIVQLSYQQGFLLVSSLYRTIIVRGNQTNKISQVGQKERKTLGKLGAVFGCQTGHVQEPLIYASRPGLRIWQADKNGTVRKTLIFKEAVRCASTEVILINPAPEVVRKNRYDPTFGVLLPFADDQIVTHSSDVVYVLNPSTITITSVVSDLRRVIDVACTKDEIFILEGERNVIRIGYYPDVTSSGGGSSIETDDSNESRGTLAEMGKPVAAGILGLTTRLKENSIVPAIPFYKIHRSNIVQAIGVSPSSGSVDPNGITRAEEATEIPIPPSSTANIIAEEIFNENSKTIGNDRREIFQKISQQDFDEDIVFTPERKTKKTNLTNFRNNPGRNHAHSTSNDENHRDLENDEKTTYSSLLTLSIDDESILNGERNIDAIRKNVEIKEKLLSDVLNFDLTEFMRNNVAEIEKTTMNESLNSITYLNCDVTSNDEIFEKSAIFHDHCNDDNDNNDENDDSADEDESYRTELRKLREMGECSKILLREKKARAENAPETNNRGRKQRGSDEDRQDSERHFNILSKEFVTLAHSNNNAGFEEIEDWVVVPSIP